MMKPNPLFTIFSVTLTVLVVGVFVVAEIQFLRASAPNLSGNIAQVSSAYPNPQYTTGVVATMDFKTLTGTYSGGTYSQTNRNVTSASKSILKKEYGSQCDAPREVDHFIPLALGGSNDVKNLWCEPEHVVIGGVDYGYPTKDRLEGLLIRMMKAQNISPSAAQSCIKADWIACYKKYATQLTRSGGFVADDDQED